MSVPQSSVHLHGSSNVVHGKRSREYSYSISGEEMSIFNSNVANGDVSIDMTSIDSYSIREENHKAGGLGSPRAMPDLPHHVPENISLCNGHSLQMNDEYKTRSQPLVVNSGNGALAGSNSQAINALQNLGSTDKAQAKYICTTQKAGCYELCIGEDDQIPRWRYGSEICYIICTESFETSGAAALVAAAMKDAISMWGQIHGVKFKEVGRDNPATFRIKFKKSHNDAGIYATSFLPTTLASSLFVYQKALENAGYLANILAHELGHILGLRHEFALKKEQYCPSVRFGSKNPQSIMNYHDKLSKLQVGEQDREEVAAFYEYDRRVISIASGAIGRHQNGYI
ncbi:hypothetical protein LI328DRAFT_164427 [Trichoderma asperelloides]|nr:hypothetical protein LI328DRAFT_164427 [Trichoderma asperelloides]